MTDYAVIYDSATGAQIGNFSGPDGAAAAQIPQLQPGQALMLVPAKAWTTPVDLPLVKADLCAKIEAQADAVAARIITLSPRKVQTAMAIKEEADRWSSGATIPFPFLQALATANGTTIAEEKDSFDAAWTAAVPPGALINATSIAAQRRVNAATTLAGIAEAAAIDWPAVMATPA